MRAAPEVQPMKALRILVVDDDTLIATLLAEVLVGMGHDVCGIESTEAGTVAAAARCKPDVMIVDALLGDGSGISAVEQILRTRFIPHVFVSGDISSIPPARSGAVVLRKPFGEPDLARALQRAVAARPAA
jgi:two-component system, response regulator PdtaR